MGSVRRITTADLAVLRATDVGTDAKRQLRKPILDAFDVYKSNLYYGVITETEEEHYQILYWYKLLLDLDEYAIENVPPAIAKYMKR